MVTRPRLVATDIDGTIHHPETGISDATVAALEAARNAGALVVLVTGRPPRWLWPVRDRLGVSGLAICANGALTVDLASTDIVTARPFAPGQVLHVADRLRHEFGGRGRPAFALETTVGARHEPAYTFRGTRPPDTPVGPLEELLDGAPTVVKLLMRVDGVPADELHHAARTLLADNATVTHSNPQDSLLEIAPPGVTKASSLAELAAQAGIDPQDCVAFGDMPNDIPMLTWAGAGYAMADGHPDTITCTDRTAQPCRRDGVALVLRELFA